MTSVQICILTGLGTRLAIPHVQDPIELPIGKREKAWYAVRRREIALEETFGGGSRRKTLSLDRRVFGIITVGHVPQNVGNFE
jgi:hypothetical protein